MFVHKAYKFRIYPTKEQEIFIAKTIGCSRFVFNHFLNQWNDTYKKTGKGLTYHACSAELTQLKKEFVWLKEVDSIALQSYTTKETNHNIAIVDKKIKLPKLRLVLFVMNITIGRSMLVKIFYPKA